MNTQPGPSVGQAYLAEARARLAACHDKIRHCLDQLNDAQVWWRPLPALNSIANLVLHLCGNLRQWLAAGVGGAPDVRDRPQEFAERGPLPKTELLRRLKAAVDEADAVLAGVADARLLDPRHIQGFDLTVLVAIFDSVSHLAGHTQEIVYATRLQLGDAYQMAWTPATPEQGAARATPGKEIADATDAVFEEGPSVLPDPALPTVEPGTWVPPTPPPATEGETPHHPTSPLGDYVREIGEEFQEEEDEGKV
jgi:hypothetical protein